MLKRTLDIIGSFIGLLLLSPIIVIIAGLIKMDSRGTVFYRQERVGRGGVLFRLIKFRTMHAHADRQQVITIGRRDPRITTVGVYLRRFKIDEFPQLYNVLIGEMSLVGPRPELKKFTDLYNEEQRKVLLVRPGLTDPASIQFRNENSMLEGKADPIAYYISDIMPVKLSLNLEYLRQQSVVKDIGILFLTVFYIFKKD